MTLHPQKRKPDLAMEVTKNDQHIKWQGLTILQHKQDRDQAIVEFVAFYYQPDQAGLQQLHERSAFYRYEKRWFYHHGEFLAPISLARNKHCFCGSGKKFKKCHWDQN